MAERERIRLGNGVAIYREYETWSIELLRRGKRQRWSLKTRDRGEAVMKSGNLLRELKAREAAIDLDFLTMATPPAYREQMRSGKLCPPAMIWDPAATRLRDQALEAVRIEGIVRRVRDEVKQPAVASISCEQAISKYESYLLNTKRLNPNYVGIMVSDIRKQVEFAKITAVSEITAQQVESWMATFPANKGQTINKKRGYVSQFLAWALRHKYVLENVAAGVGKARTAPVITDVYSKDQLEAIFRKIRGKSYAKVIQLAFWTGLDKGDLSKLTADEINLLARRITGYRNKTKKSRGDGIPIFDQVLALVNTLPRKGRIFGQWTSLDCVAKKANKLGIDFRKLRRSFVSHLIANGVSMTQISQWAVHDPITEAKSYAKPTGEPMTFTWHGSRLEAWGLPKIEQTPARQA